MINFKVSLKEKVKYVGGLSEITRIKSHELMFLNCNLEGDFLLENIFMQNQLNIWFGSCFLIKYCLLNGN